MISNSLLFLTSISQWGLFIGIAAIIFGWVEKKEAFVIAGQVAFLLGGVWAAWILFTGQIVVPETVTEIISKPVKTLSYFRGVLAFSGYSVVCFLLRFFNFRYQKYAIYIQLFLALMLFFIVFNIQQMNH